MFAYLWIFMLLLYFFIGGFFFIKDVKEFGLDTDLLSVSSQVYLGFLTVVLFIVFICSLAKFFVS